MEKANEKMIRVLEETPDYNPEEWVDFLDAGCYPYVLNMKVNKFFLIGDLIGKTCTSTTSDEVLIETLKEELETIMDYEVKEVDIRVQHKKGEKKIYLHRFNHSGHYHLYRQDSDGKWSHKYPAQLPNRQYIEKAIDDNSFTGWCLLLKRKKSV